MPNDMTCECGKSNLNARTMEIHRKSKAHLGWEAMQTDDPDSLPPDLQAPVDLVDEDPFIRVKMVRAAFGARGWPNSQHPGTVRDFCEQHGIPVLDVPRHMPAGDAQQYTLNWVKEHTNV